MVDWDDVLQTHGPMVWRTVYRLLGHQADAWDCYQETFLAAYRAVGRRRVEHWPSFLTSLATRRAIDRLRQRVRSRRRCAPLESVPEPIDLVGSVSDRLQTTETLDAVREVLAGLPTKQAEVFWLSGVEGVSHRQISEQLGLGEGEVRVLLHRARRSLRAWLGSSLNEMRSQP